MSRNAGAPGGPGRAVDRRVQRTRDALGDALVTLLKEKPFDSISVQDVLDRAGVGRSTFYSHFKDKDDLWVSDVDEFLDHFAGALSRSADGSDRVAPVREFLAHVGENKGLHRALVESGRIHHFNDLARDHFARAIERRLAEVPAGGAIDARRRAPLAHAMAGALLSLVSWWLDRSSLFTPQEMDDLFHRWVWSGAAASPGETRGTT